MSKKGITQIEELFGKWTLIKTEIPNHSIGSESLEFTSENKLIWIVIDKKNIYNYSISDSAILYEVNEKLVEVAGWFESGILVLRPEHGYKSWFKEV